MNACAREGCGKPARGKGGTSKYCSMACLEADESDDEDVSACAASGCEKTAHGEISLRMEPLGDKLLKGKVAVVSVDQLEANLSAAQPLERLIFLDVDGVLNIQGETAASPGVITSGTPMVILNRDCLRRLVGLVRETQARLVLSSTWRDSLEMKADLLAALVDEGLPEDTFVGQTPDICRHLRQHEIVAWLDENFDASTKAGIQWIVLDDMQLGHAPELKQRFVWIDPEVGLSDKDVKVATRTLWACTPPPQPHPNPRRSRFEGDT